MTFDALLQQRDALESQLADAIAERARLAEEREKYRALYLETLETCRKLERGLLGQKAERLSVDDRQLAFDVLSTLLGPAAPPPASPNGGSSKRGSAPKRNTTGRQRPPETLPRVVIEVVPPEVQHAGLDAFTRIGEETSEVIERRPASVVVVQVVRPKFVRKGERPEGEAAVTLAEPLELPITRGLAGPGFLADTLVRRWQDHLPLHRLEGVYGREGLPLSRSTLCGWHLQLAELVRPLIDAMWLDARAQPYLCTDATGVLVQAKEKCRNGHFWVVVAPGRHVLFAFSRRHNSAAVDELLGGYGGYIVADAATVYDHLYRDGTAKEVACWAHTRRYFFKAVSSEPERAKEALHLIGALFKMERDLAGESAKRRARERNRRGRKLVKQFFTWCEQLLPSLLDDTPLAKAVGYARNQRQALERFLEDPRLPIHNNVSERALRRQAVGRKNWLFVGNEDGAEANTLFVSLLASCQMHGVEPLGYLRDLLCLLPSWSTARLLELAPAEWSATSQRADVRAALEANIFRRVSLQQIT